MINLAALVCVMTFLLIGGISIFVDAERRQEHEEREAEEAREKTLQTQVTQYAVDNQLANKDIRIIDREAGVKGGCGCSDQGVQRSRQGDSSRAQSSLDGHKTHVLCTAPLQYGLKDDYFEKMIVAKLRAQSSRGTGGQRSRIRRYAPPSSISEHCRDLLG